MNRNLTLLIIAGVTGVALLALAMNQTSFESSDHESADAKQARAMVSRALEYMSRHGGSALVEKVNADAAPEFHEGELYVFVLDNTGAILAHPIDAGLAGMDDQAVKDADGNTFLARMASMTADNPDGSWFDYRWSNPVTGKAAMKSSWIVARDGYVVGVGIYPEEN